MLDPPFEGEVHIFIRIREKVGCPSKGNSICKIHTHETGRLKDINRVDFMEGWREVRQIIEGL